MPSVLHLVTTENFAGVERYVCTTAAETAKRGYDVTVIGGLEPRMRSALPAGVRWLPGTHAATALRAVGRAGRFDVCHAHMTVAEGLAVLARPLHGAPIVSTRHFAAHRGSTRAGRLAAPHIAARITREIAISEYVARSLEAPPDAVIVNGVPSSACLWSERSRTVLVLQRLEREKDTMTALRAWQASGLANTGWALRVVGDGAERPALEAWVSTTRMEGITFMGWSSEVSQEFAGAGLLLAPSPCEPFGLAIVEAMAAGVPVAACGAGGHLETIGRVPGAALFAAGDVDGAAARLRAFSEAGARRSASSAGRTVAAERFTVAGHVDRLLAEYELAAGRTARPIRRRRRTTTSRGLNELVVCSLEPWDEVWRRNQFFTDALLRRHPDLRVLFVEPPADPLFDLVSRRAPAMPRSRPVAHDRRLRAFRPVKPLPRKAGAIADDVVRRQVLAAIRLNGMRRPTLWVNDVTYAPLLASKDWPSVYDVTDDWLLAPFSARELSRLRRLDALALTSANEVVVCSQSLVASRGAFRPVSLIPNGVDAAHFRRPRPRPADLPESPVAVYVGSLHDARIDVDLVVSTAASLPAVTFAFVGPESLSADSHRRLARCRNVVFIGSRPYEDVPAYLQHADVVVVPHLVSPFTESLDPIKAYECLAVDTPTVATPVAGFREHSTVAVVVDRSAFAPAVERAISTGRRRATRLDLPSWNERASAFETILRRAGDLDCPDE